MNISLKTHQSKKDDLNVAFLVLKQVVKSLVVLNFSEFDGAS